MRLAVSLALLVLGASVASRASAQCAIEGLASGITITVREAGERGYHRVRLERPTRVAYAPMRTGISSIRVLEGEPIEGTTRDALPIAIGRPISIGEGTIELPAGLPVARARPAPEGPWVEIDVAIGDELHLRRLPVPCADLTLASGEPSIAALEAVNARGPAWRARTTRLDLFDRPSGDRSMRLEIAPGSPARLVEIDRRVPWVRVVLRTSLGARVRAWVRDWDLVR